MGKYSPGGILSGVQEKVCGDEVVVNFLVFLNNYG
jgi:hypothetical protein